MTTYKRPDLNDYINSLDEVPPPAYVVSGASLRAIPPGDERGIRYRWSSSPAVQNNYEFVVLDALPDGYELRGSELVRFPDGKRAAGHEGQKTCSACQAVWWMDCDEVAHKHPLKKRVYDQDLGKIVGEALTGAKAGELAHISLYNGEPGSPSSEVVYSSYARIDINNLKSFKSPPDDHVEPVTVYGSDVVLLIADEAWHDESPGFGFNLVGHQLMLCHDMGGSKDSRCEWHAILVDAFDALSDTFFVRPIVSLRRLTEAERVTKPVGDFPCYLGDPVTMSAAEVVDKFDSDLTEHDEECLIVDRPAPPREVPHRTRYKPGTVDVGWDPGE